MPFPNLVQMKYDKLEYFVSQPRLNRFLTASANSKSKAQKLYQANLRVAQSFYPVLSLFEVILRNVCNYQISSVFANPNWIITEKNGFMSDRSLSRSRFFLKNAVLNAERSILRTGRTITAGKIIAEQSLGFWTSFFEPHHYRLVRGAVIQGFPNKPASANRSTISQKLIRIREFRNRIYHNEPICFNHAAFDFTYAIQTKQDIYDLLEWIDTDLPLYVQSYDTIDRRINSASNLI